MKIIITIFLLILAVNIAKSQFATTILQTFDTTYYQVGRLGTSNYIAALRQNALDIRETTLGTFGVLKQTAVISSAILVDAKMEIEGNFVYVFSYDIIPIDVSNPLLPVIGTSLPLIAKAVSTNHAGSFLYVSTNNNKTYIYSITSPAAPVLVDSINFFMDNIKQSNNKLYSIFQSTQNIYSWNLSPSPPYLTLSDSIQIPNSFLLSMDIYENQLIVKNTDSLYRFRINTASDFILISSELMPAYPFNGSLIVRDTNIIAYSMYNSLYISSGIPGNSFVDSARINVDGNYTISSMLLDNNLFYSNTAHSYLIGFTGNSLGISNNQLDADLEIFPNPASSMLTIGLKNGELKQIKIWNVFGEEITTIAPNNNQSTLNTNQYSKGIYFIEITDKMQNNCIKKIVFQ